MAKRSYRYFVGDFETTVYKGQVNTEVWASAVVELFTEDVKIFCKEFHDGKIGRINIPRKLLENIGVTKEVVFSGNDHKIEIWAKERFESSRLSNEEYISLAGMLSELK